MNKKRIRELMKRIGQAREFYYNGESIISDDEYDALVDELTELDPYNLLLKEIGAPVTDARLTKVQHEIPMGSLDKINNENELKRWLQKRGCGKDTLVMIQEKLDGFSVEIIYNKGKFKQAITRGDGVVGEDISHNARHMQEVPEKLPNKFTGSLRGEAIISKKDFEEHFGKGGYANPRNAAAGISRKKNTDKNLIRFVKVIYFDCLGSVEFNTEEEKLSYIENHLVLEVVSGTVCQASKILKFQKAFDRDKLLYEIDALVIKINDIAKQDELGSLHGRPKGQIAWKFAAEMRETKVRSVSWEVGLTGRITPLAHVSPVKIGGVTISKVNLHNVSNVETLGVGPGATVLVSRRNDVIPYIEKVVLPTKPAVIPTKCPICKSELAYEGEFLVCQNEDSCMARKFGNIEKWIKVTEIEEAGQGFLTDAGMAGLVKDVSDLYKLKVSDLLKLDGYKTKKATKIIENIQSKKTLPFSVFMAALNIPNIGKTVFNLLEKAGYTDIDALSSCSVEDLAKVEGIGNVKAKSVVTGLKKNRKRIKRILDAGVKIEEKKSGTLSGISFCFTGALSIRRSDAQNYVKSLGGEVKTGVSKGLTYLVQANPNSNSTKSQKARKYGTKIINEDEFMELTDFSVEKLVNL